MPSAATTIAPLPPDTIAGYRVARALGEHSFLCLAPGDRYVVLKPLDNDCLLKGGLHPAIKERLARVRELAHAGVANLYSVDRDEHGGAWLVWQYAPGESLDTFMATRLPPPRDVWVIARELVLAVEALHARGIVHGAIHERNVIVEGADRVRLTHVSPLLYVEPADDELAVLDLLERIGTDVHDRLGQVAMAARAQPLRHVRSQLAALIASRELASIESPHAPVVRSTRKTSLIAAGGLVLLAAGLAYGVKRLATPSAAPIDQPLTVRR